MSQDARSGAASPNNNVSHVHTPSSRACQQMATREVSERSRCGAARCWLAQGLGCELQLSQYATHITIFMLRDAQSLCYSTNLSCISAISFHTRDDFPSVVPARQPTDGWIGKDDLTRRTNHRRYTMAVKINIHTLLDAGCHYGHQTRRWNPKMRPYIFGERNGIYILDLKQTIINGDRAYTTLRDIASKGGTVLFVGTKKQAQESIQTQAERAGMPYINQRWLGGMLTNFVTMRSRIDRMEELEAMVEDGRMNSFVKKEQAMLTKELEKLQRNLGGVREMKTLPQAIFVVDTKREEIAVKEANRLHIPVIGLLDTNSDPDVIDYGIPANDDAIRSVALMCELVADAILAGSGKEQISAEEMLSGETTPAVDVESAAAAEPVTE